jgi:sulfoxide reductase heme-binding subunit YedZ
MDTALWDFSRATGVVALVLLTVSLCLGITVKSRTRPAGLPQYGVTALHKSASLTATGLIGVHLVTLLLDSQAKVNLTDLVVPFLGTRHPFWQGLGTLAVEVLGLVVLSGLARRRLGERAFRWLHLTSYALWPLALLHGLGNGTDARTPWMLTLSAGCTIAVLACAWWRLGPDFGRRSAAPRLHHPEALRAAHPVGGEALAGQPVGQ